MAIWYKVIIGIIPAAVVGIPLDDVLNEYLYNYQTVAIMLVLYGILFIVIENRNQKRNLLVGKVFMSNTQLNVTKMYC